MTNFLKNQKGFTIFEIIVAIFVISLGILAAYSLTSQIISDTSTSISRLTAAYLAQEGIEIARNIRDNNWVSAIAANSTAEDLVPGDYQADYTSSELEQFNSTPLSINDAGLYGYDPNGALTNFSREINIVDENDYTKVIVTVNWKEKNKDYYVQVQENLYPWLPVTPQ